MGYLEYEQKGFVGLVTLNRPQALNVLKMAVLEELEVLLDGLDTVRTRCLVITGAGEKAFAAGADIGDMLALDKTGAAAHSARGNAILTKLEACPVPTIAAVNGFALGGGCELAMACDIRLASEKAVFAQPEVGLGITAGFGGTFRLARLVGPAVAKELLFTGQKINAATAERMGLVNRVCADNALLDEALALAEKIAAAAPLAVRATKRAINGGLGRASGAAATLEAACFADCFESRDQKNAMAAFVEKRKAPPFTGE